MKVRNPRTGAYDYEITPPSAGELDRIVKELRTAQPQWAALAVEARVTALKAWQCQLVADKSHLIAALAADTGRTRVSLIEFDIVSAAIDRWCRQAPDLLKSVAGQSAIFPHVRFVSQEVPYQVVGVIAPWNFPLVLSSLDTVPALLAGCSVLIKPSEVTPRFVEPLEKTLRAVPELAGVVRYVQGAGDIGAAVIDRSDVVCFTGSIKTGRKVAEQAARNFIPAFLELGGKDPLIVLASADVERAATATLRASINNAGQACQSIERIYVAAPIYDAFVERLVDKARAVDLSYPDPHLGVTGPLIFATQADIIARHLDDAVAKGAKIRTGGKVEKLGGGLWVRPTVLTDVTHDMLVMQEETFGPLMPVMRFKTVDEAVTLANDSEYGLSGSVIAGSVEEALPVARRINDGAISINDAGMTALTQEAEKNSFKLSGLGASRMGAPGILRFIRRKALIINDGTPLAIELFDESTVRG